MPSHFSTIGFAVENQQDYAQLLERIAQDAGIVNSMRGQYLVWAGNGAELWLQVDREGAIVGVNPHFTGRSRMSVGLTLPIERPEDSPLDAAYYGWADPPGDNPEEGMFPFVFDSPDGDRHRQLALPTVRTVQLAAFAHELSIYESPEEFDLQQEGQELRMAHESFIPSGLFRADGESTESPEAYAIFTGRILSTATEINPVTGLAFHWAHVQTLGGTVDVVCDPELVPRPLVEGGLLSGSFWLSGRIL